MKTAANEPIQPQPARSIPVSPAPAAAPPSLPSGPNEAIINSDLAIVGEFRSKGRLTLSGSIEGEVRCESLVVTTEGKIVGKVIAQEVVIHGYVEGSVYGNSVDVYSSSTVKGDIFHHGIGIEKGTKYDGTLRYLDNPVAEGESSS